MNGSNNVDWDGLLSWKCMQVFYCFLNMNEAGADRRPEDWMEIIIAGTSSLDVLDGRAPREGAEGLFTSFLFPGE